MSGIAELRKKAGMTQKDLADALNVERSTVAKWETGTSFPTWDKIPQVAEALKCGIGDLFKKDGEKNGRKERPT